MCESLRPVPHNLFAPKIENSVEDLKTLSTPNSTVFTGTIPRS